MPVPIEDSDIAKHMLQEKLVRHPSALAQPGSVTLEAVERPSTILEESAPSSPTEIAVTQWFVYDSSGDAAAMWRRALVKNGKARNDTTNYNLKHM